MDKEEGADFISIVRVCWKFVLMLYRLLLMVICTGFGFSFAKAMKGCDVGVICCKSNVGVGLDVVYLCIVSLFNFLLRITIM